MKNEELDQVSCSIELRKLGVSVAIDDFGIGYSSLGGLNDFPVNRLKIDRSFVQGVDTPGRHATLVAAILSMAKALGLDVVAEGVEDFNQLLHLQDQHCNEVQGYLLSKPLPVEQVTELLERLATATPPAARCACAAWQADRRHSSAVRRSKPGGGSRHVPLGGLRFPAADRRCRDG